MEMNENILTEFQSDPLDNEQNCRKEKKTVIERNMCNRAVLQYSILKRGVKKGATNRWSSTSVNEH